MEVKDICIENEHLINGVLRRRITSNVVRLCYVTETLSMANKIKYVVRHISGIRYEKAKVCIVNWEKVERLVKILRECKISTYKIIREYKDGICKNGEIDVHFEASQIDQKFLDRLVRRHFGYDFSLPHSISVCPIFVFETKYELMIIHLYDDRGFYEYLLKK